MNITLSRRPRELPGVRGLVLGGGVLLAAIATAAAGPAALASQSAAEGKQVRQAAGIKPKPRGAISWSVVPASATAPQPGRSIFSYTNIKPGSTISDHVAVINRSSGSVTFNVYATDATGTTAQNVLTLLPTAKTPVDIGSWVTFPHHVKRLSIIIPAGKAVIEPFTIAVPGSATPGDHTGGMIAAVGFQRKGPNGAVVTMDERIAVPLELRVFGPIHAALSVESISAGFGTTVNPFGDGRATVSYTLHNAGNVRLTGSEAVSVTGPFGMSAKAKGVQLPTVLPGDSVRITQHAKGLYPAGPLTAHVHVTPANPEGAPPLAQPLAAANGSASLFAVPWPLIGLLILLGGAGFGGWRLLQWRRKRLRETLTAVAASVRAETEERVLAESGNPVTKPQGQ